LYDGRYTLEVRLNDSRRPMSLGVAVPFHAVEDKLIRGFVRQTGKVQTDFSGRLYKPRFGLANDAFLKDCPR
jgi:hypothetical protein